MLVIFNVSVTGPLFPSIRPPEPEIVGVVILFPFVSRLVFVLSVKLVGINVRVPLPTLLSCAVPVPVVLIGPAKLRVVLAATLNVVVAAPVKIQGLLRAMLLVVCNVPPFPVILPVPTLEEELIDKVPFVTVVPPENVLSPERVTVDEEALITTAPIPPFELLEIDPA